MHEERLATEDVGRWARLRLSVESLSSSLSHAAHLQLRFLHRTTLDSVVTDSPAHAMFLTDAVVGVLSDSADAHFHGLVAEAHVRTHSTARAGAARSAKGHRSGGVGEHASPMSRRGGAPSTPGAHLRGPVRAGSPRSGPGSPR